MKARKEKETRLSTPLKRPRVRPMRRCPCGGRVQAIEHQKVYAFKGRRRIVLTVPAWRCLTCGEVYIDGPSLGWAERAAAVELAQTGPATPETFRFMRRAVRIKSAELAELLGVSVETLSRWENGHREPDRTAWVALSGLVLDEVGARTATRERLRAAAGLAAGGLALAVLWYGARAAARPETR